MWYLAKLVKGACFPADMVNVLNGYGYQTGAAMASDAGIYLPAGPRLERR